MNDPHVSLLKYRLRAGLDVSYKPGTSIRWTTPEFDGEMIDGLLRVMIKTHYAMVGSAQEAVDAYLRAWEIQAVLDFGPGNLDFEFDSYEIIDRRPPPRGSTDVPKGSACGNVAVWSSAEGYAQKLSYPPPPANFSMSPIVSTLWHRYRNFLENKEPLTGMGYFCL
ncbi:MAG: hypothetical protein NTY19_43790 [Planctomycetota bacterium]|nr:hypothetical protein [Planctomycetota bacterium]